MTTNWVSDPREILVAADCYSSAMRRAVAVVVFASFAVAACSGSDESASTDPPVTEQTTTAAEAVTTTEVATTSTVETTVAPTTTVDEEARLRAAEQAYIESWEAYHAAILDPSNPDLRAEVERTFTGPNLSASIEALDDYVDAAFVARPNPDVQAEVLVLTPALPVPGEDDLIDLIACEVNSEAYFEVGSRPDGGDSLIRDEVVVLRLLVRIRLVDGLWKSESGETLSRSSGDVGCLE